MVGKASCAELPIDPDLCHDVSAPCARHRSATFIKRDKSQLGPITALSNRHKPRINPRVLKGRIHRALTVGEEHL